MKLKKIFLFSFLIFSTLCFSQTFYVDSLNGNDSSPSGSSTSPFKTIKKAKETVNIKLSQFTVSNPMSSDIIVYITGEYFLDEPLSFTGSDSGKNGFNVIYKALTPNNKPIIHSGQIITDWLRVGTSNIWKATAPNYSRQLFIDNAGTITKGIRARSLDNMGLLETKTGYVYNSSCTDFSTWPDIKDMEIVSNMRWRHSRLPIYNICNKQIIIEDKFWKEMHGANNGVFNRAPVIRLENAYELLNEENEWYIDRSTNTNLLYLVSSVSPNTAPFKIIVPKLEQLITATGLQNVQFQDLVFRYTNWNTPSKKNTNPLVVDCINGFWTKQSDATVLINNNQDTNNSNTFSQIPSALNFTYSKSIVFNNCDFDHIGATALGFLIGSKNNIICNNTFTDISASGIYLGDYETALTIGKIPTANMAIDTPNRKKLVEDNKINNNFISNIANEYLSSCGILVSFARGTEIAHNTIEKFPYIGISVGWEFNRGVVVGTNNIRFNRVDCRNQTMPDGGGIYTCSNLGTDTISGSNSLKTKIIENYVLNQRKYRGAIYLDGYSCNVEVSKNLVDIENDIDINRDINGSNPNNNTFEDYVECVKNDVVALECYWYSENINIFDNYYNNKYKISTSFSIYDCASCHNISILNNKCFSGFNGYNTPSTNCSVCFDPPGTLTPHCPGICGQCLPVSAITSDEVKTITKIKNNSGRKSDLGCFIITE